MIAIRCRAPWCYGAAGLCPYLGPAFNNLEEQLDRARCDKVEARVSDVLYEPIRSSSELGCGLVVHPIVLEDNLLPTDIPTLRKFSFDFGRMELMGGEVLPTVVKERALLSTN